MKKAVATSLYTPTTRSSRFLLGAVLLGVLVVHMDMAHASGDPETLTVEQFLARIEGGLPEFEIHEAELLAAQAEIAAAETLPALGLSYEREEVFVDGEAVVQKSALAVDWSFDPSGRRGHRIQSAELSALATRKRNLHNRHLIVVGALEVYYRAARAKLRVASLQKNHGPLDTLVEQLKLRVAEGDASGYDLARFELERAEHHDHIAEAEAEYTVAQARLAALLGVSAHAIDPTDTLSLPNPPQGSRGTSLGSARRDVEAMAHEEESGTALTRAARRWWIPTLDLSVGYMNTESGPGADLAHGYTALVSASVPIFSRGEAERKRGEARLRRAQATRKILERQIPVAVQTAEDLLRTRIARTRRFTTQQLVQVAVLLQKTEGAYHGGEASALELRDAYHQAAAAELRHIELRFQCRMAQLRLWRATGERGQ